MNEQRMVGWFGIVRMGLVQTALGAIVVLTTSTLNRVMVVELLMPAVLPGLLVGWHYALQVLRPRWGFGSDRTGRRTPWILSGMAILAAGGFLAAVATAWMGTNTVAGIALGLLAFTMIGIGVGASGTSLLVLLSQSVPEGRRAPAATIIWIMMIMGFVVTAITAGRFLDPYSHERLVAVTGAVSAIAFCVAALALWGLEGPAQPRIVQEAGDDARFMRTLAAVWAEPRARRFTIFVFVSMLAYATQDLILEPFAGTVFGMTPGQSTQLGGLQHAGVLIGMLVVGIAGALRGGSRVESLQRFMVSGCIGSGLALALLAVAGTIGPDFPLKTTVIVLGVFNGAFAIAAIGAMMAMAGEGDKARHGTRMGLWGAAQAVAFGIGGLLGTIAADIARLVLPDPVAAYGSVFAFEALLFVASAILAIRVARDARDVAAVSEVSPVSTVALEPR